MNGDPLAQLRDIHLPAAVSWWPPATGWWLLLLLLILSALGAAWHWRRRRSALSRQAALAELDHIAQLPPAQQLGALSILLRRCALAWYPRQDVAAIVGNAWLAFLDQSGQTRQFSEGAGRILALGPYQNQAPAATALQALCRQWINTAYPRRSRHV